MDTTLPKGLPVIQSTCLQHQHSVSTIKSPMCEIDIYWTTFHRNGGIELTLMAYYKNVWYGNTQQGGQRYKNIRYRWKLFVVNVNEIR